MTLRPVLLCGERVLAAFESDLPTLSSYVDARTLCADMVNSTEAAALAGTTTAQLRRWATVKAPRILALRNSVLGWRYPRWRFEAATWQAVGHLSRALQCNAPAMLAWLETPHGALEGRTPRMALGQGESAQRVLALAASEGL
jgi:hypothetical protein